MLKAKRMVQSSFGAIVLSVEARFESELNTSDCLPAGVANVLILRTTQKKKKKKKSGAFWCPLDLPLCCATALQSPLDVAQFQREHFGLTVSYLSSFHYFPR